MTAPRKTAATKKQEDSQEAVETPKATEAQQEAVETPKGLTVVVASKFIDRHTGEARNPGDVIEVTQERLEEILAAGKYVEEPAK